MPTSIPPLSLRDPDKFYGVWGSPDSKAVQDFKRGHPDWIEMPVDWNRPPPRPRSVPSTPGQPADWTPAMAERQTASFGDGSPPTAEDFMRVAAQAREPKGVPPLLDAGQSALIGSSASNLPNQEFPSREAGQASAPGGAVRLALDEDEPSDEEEPPGQKHP